MEPGIGDGASTGAGHDGLATRYGDLRSEGERIAGGAAGFFRRRETLRAIEDECGLNSVFPVIALREHGPFVSFYTDYRFSKQYGRDPGAARFVDPALLCLFNRLHDAVADGEVLSSGARRALYSTACSVYAGDDMVAAAC
ncbi:MAG: hypothetical protein U5Q44_05215 [Dehalococcoidia bacterium]|nr:hypothetical protein [Dehalococcoidia bacterium]